MEQKIPLLAVVGPTASGKTALAVELAKCLDGEVVSADSMQIYRGMDIGTAKPTPEEMGGIPHHLLSFLELSQTFSVAQYVELARACAADIHRRGKLPILAGGTGLYVSSMLHHLQFSEEKTDGPLRERLQQRLRDEGAESLLEELRRIDPDTADRLHPNNQKRIVRALELYYTTGVTMSEHIRRSREQPSPYRSCVIGLDFRDRQTLYRRINRRVDEMMEKGLAEEATRVLSAPFGRTAMGAIGYKEFQPWLDGACSLEQAVEAVKQSTRRYAKRQLTWFRREADIHWIFVDECENREEIVRRSLQYVAREGLCPEPA